MTERVSVQDLLRQQQAQVAAEAQATETAQTEESPPARKSKVATGRQRRRWRPRRRLESGSPKWQQLERKEVLLFGDQLDELTMLRRQLNRERPKGVGERITENTLIRVAVDLLLTHADALRGTTEDELRESAISELRD